MTSVMDQQLSAAAYHALERRIQELRLRILRAAQPGGTKAKTEQTVVRPENVRAALQQVASNWESGDSAKGAQSSINVQQDAYLYLEGRLDRLRRHLVRVLNLSETSYHTKPIGDAKRVESAWNQVIQNKPMISSLLLRDEDSTEF